MEHHTPLFRRMLAAAVSAVMLMTLAACSEAPADHRDPESRPAVTDPQEQSGRDPAVTEPRQSDPTQPATQPTTVPATEPGIEVDPEALVTDAHRYQWEDDYGYEYCYHIPSINLSACATVNDRIFGTLFPILERDVKESIDEYGEPILSRMSYIWNYAGGVISILVEMPDNYTDWADYLVYYVSAETGELLEAADLLRECGLSERDFRLQVYDTLDAYWEELLASQSAQDREALEEMNQQLIDETLSEENIQSAVPFLHADGNLSFLVSVYVPAGAGELRALFDYDTGALLDHYECIVDHDISVTP